MKGLLCMCLLFLCANSHIVRNSYLHKRMANQRDLFNDFVAINGGPEGLEAVTSKNAAKPIAQAGDACNPTKCNTNELMKPGGDPKAKSSAIALQAAQDAKAANEAQSAAGQAAAQHIKAELAEKAFQSAKAAEAALMGKQMMVDQLEQETKEAIAVVEGETASLQAIETSMNAAVEASKGATQQFEALNDLIANSKNNVANIQGVATSLQQEMDSKTQLLQAARNRLSTFQKHLSNAREDYEKTKQAAYKAACAAVEAKQKATGVQRTQRKIRQY